MNPERAKVLVNETVWNKQYLLEEGLDIAFNKLNLFKIGKNEMIYLPKNYNNLIIPAGIKILDAVKCLSPSYYEDMKLILKAIKHISIQEETEEKK